MRNLRVNFQPYEFPKFPKISKAPSINDDRLPPLVLSPARMRRCLCLRPSIPLPPPRPFPRTIHTAPLTRAQASFTDSFRRPVEEELEDEDLDDVEDSANSESDDTAYAERVSAQSYQRWRESQDPQAGLQFMTMGREFTIPYSLTQLSNMSNNHLRELRAYYRKMMYEMPQFKSILLPIVAGVGGVC